MRWTAFFARAGRFFFAAAVLTLACARAAEPDFLLANPFREGLDLSRYVVSEKLDGVRAQWDGEKLISRRGNVFAAPEWFAAGLPTARLDGELWGGRGTFETVSGIVRRARPHDGWRAVRFMVFDAPDEAGDFLTRLAALRRIAAAANNPHLQVVAHEPIESGAWLMKKLAAVAAAGGEGLMLRRKESPYRGGRGDDLIKLKPFADAEAVVISHHPGKGKFTGLLGAMTVENADEIRFRIGTGFSNAERANPPPPGATVTYRHNGFNKNGLPRFPVFLRIRDEEPRAAP